MRRALFVAALACAGVTAAVVAQAPNPGPTAPARAVPRDAQGHPDFSGNWQPTPSGVVRNLRKAAVGGAELTPAGEAAWRHNATVTDPEGLCIPTGTPRNSLAGFPFAIVQNTNRVAFLYELMSYWRLIPTDAREHPKEFELSYAGDAVGRWDGDTLVIDIIGIKDQLSWMDAEGSPKSDALHVVERWRRPAFDRLEVEIVGTDPKFYTKPWTLRRAFRPMPEGDRPMEYACSENNLSKDAGRLGVGWEDRPSQGTAPR